MKRLAIFLITLLISIFSTSSGQQTIINISNKLYTTGSLTSDFESNYSNLKSTIEADSGRNSGEFFDEDIFQKFRHRYLDFRTAEWLLKNIRMQ